MSEDSLRDLWDTINQANIYIIGVPGEEREKGRKLIGENNGEIMVKPGGKNRYPDPGSPDSTK